MGGPDSARGAFSVDGADEKRRDRSSCAFPPEVAGAETADVTGEGVGGIDYVIENAEGSQHLGDIAEADTGTSGLDPPQSIPSDAGAFGDLLRGQTEDHAPTMDVRPEVLHLTIDSVSGHVHPPYGDYSSQ